MKIEKQKMKIEKQKIIPYILPVFMLCSLAIFLFIQFLSVKTMYRQELWHLELDLHRNTITTSQMLEEEILLLPALIKSKQSDIEKIKQKASNDIQFWSENAVSNELYSKIWLVDLSDKETVFEWNGTLFSELTITEAVNNSFISIEIVDAISKELHGKNSISYITVDDGKDYILAPATSTESSCFIVCRVDTSVLASKVIPVFVEKFFKNSSTYYMRVTDLVSKKVIYQNEEDIEPDIFDKPDFLWNIFSSGEKGGQSLSYTVIDYERNFQLENFADNASQAFSVFRNSSMRLGDGGDDLSPPFDIKSNSLKYEEKLPERGELLFEVVHRDGSVFKAAWNTTFVNAITSVLVFIILLGGFVILQTNLQKARRLARKQQEFISTVTHELKTPIAVISSASQNMSAGIITTQEKILQYGAMIKKESDRLKTTIDFFLLYGNLNTASKLNMTSLDLCELVSDVISRTGQKMRMNGFNIETSLPGKPVMIQGDKIALMCVVQNLLDNAEKHASSGKYAGIFLSIEDFGKRRQNKHKDNEQIWKYAVLSVVDKGNGIPKKDRAKLFDLFTRGEAARENQIEGSGIGLNLSKRILAIHHGTIELTSTSSEGSVFTVKLPLL